MKLIKKYRGKASEKVKYHVYDSLNAEPFDLRYKELKDNIEEMELDHIEVVPTFKVNSMKEVEKFHSIFLEDGYEGTIIRWGTEGYELIKE